VMKIKAQ